jgi:hypothetical protein
MTLRLSDVVMVAAVMQPFQGWWRHYVVTQGSSRLATLGSVI